MAARALSSLPTLGRLTISRVETRKQEIQGPRAINFPDFNFLPNGKLRKCIGGMAKRCGGDECFEMTLTWKLNKMRAIAQRSLPSKLCGNFPFGGSCYAPLHVLSIFRFNNLGKGFEIDCFVYVSHHGNSVYAYLQSMEGFSRFFLSLTTLAVNCCCVKLFPLSLLIGHARRNFHPYLMIYFEQKSLFSSRHPREATACYPPMDPDGCNRKCNNGRQLKLDLDETHSVR